MSDIQDKSGDEQIEEYQQKHDFINILAHDLKAPIASVKGFIEMLEFAGDLNEEQVRYSERAINGLLKMGRLIDDVLELARLEAQKSIKFVPVNLKEIIDECMDLFGGVAETHGITLTSSLAQGADMVVGDPRMLTVVFNNLVGNAIKYNHDHGHVWINAYRHRDFVRVDIRDDGLGISESEQIRVFQPFYRAKNKQGREGTGIGLTISQTIVRQHRGQLTVKSMPGEGSTFSFTIPSVTTPNYTNYSYAGEHSDGMDDSLQDSSESLEIDSSEDEI